jgi:hypothetical protein
MPTSLKTVRRAGQTRDPKVVGTPLEIDATRFSRLSGFFVIPRATSTGPRQVEVFQKAEFLVGKLHILSQAT